MDCACHPEQQSAASRRSAVWFIRSNSPQQTDHHISCHRIETEPVADQEYGQQIDEVSEHQAQHCSKKAVVTVGCCGRSGVSRMSAYHHFGMVSPFRIARDAIKAKGRSSEKFADEFMTWRELAYSFCYHNASKLESFQVGSWNHTSAA